MLALEGRSGDTPILLSPPAELTLDGVGRIAAGATVGLGRDVRARVAPHAEDRSVGADVERLAQSPDRLAALGETAPPPA